MTRTNSLGTTNHHWHFAYTQSRAKSRRKSLHEVRMLRRTARRHEYNLALFAPPWR
eukprot:COSAG02_NODE_61466_length_268_cov_0.917160_1_plen_55_part_10